MRAARLTWLAALALPLALWGSARIAAPVGQTWVELTNADTGTRILARVLGEGDEVTLTWTNSLFGLQVTEVFEAREGILHLTRITFADPSGRPAPRVGPAEVEELYHTGGPFRAEGLSRPVRRVIFRVGEIGDPRIRVGEAVVRLAEQVGFGGAVRLIARPPSLQERLAAWSRGWPALSRRRPADGGPQISGEPPPGLRGQTAAGCSTARGAMAAPGPSGQTIKG